MTAENAYVAPIVQLLEHGYVLRTLAPSVAFVARTMRHISSAGRCRSEWAHIGLAPPSPRWSRREPLRAAGFAPSVDVVEDQVKKVMASYASRFRTIIEVSRSSGYPAWWTLPPSDLLGLTVSEFGGGMISVSRKPRLWGAVHSAGARGVKLTSLIPAQAMSGSVREPALKTINLLFCFPTGS